jgi:cell division protease FtsH
MSPAIGPIAVVPSDGMGPLLPGAAETSETTQRLVDDEIRRIVESAHTEVTSLLREHRDHLDGLANALLEQETLDEADAYAAAGLPRRVAAGYEPAPAGHLPGQGAPDQSPVSDQM